jgi:hypothetical protein
VTLSLLPFLALLLTVAGIWASVAERRGESVGQAKAADAAAGRYESDVATFRAHVIRELARHRGAHAGELRDVLDREIPKFPTLPSPAPPGADKSRSYQAAVQTSRTGLKPFTDLREQLNTAAQADSSAVRVLPWTAQRRPCSAARWYSTVRRSRSERCRNCGLRSPTFGAFPCRPRGDRRRRLSMPPSPAP